MANLLTVWCWSYILFVSRQGRSWKGHHQQRWLRLCQPRILLQWPHRKDFQLMCMKQCLGLKQRKIRTLWMRRNHLQRLRIQGKNNPPDKPHLKLLAARHSFLQWKLQLDLLKKNENLRGIHLKWLAARRSFPQWKPQLCVLKKSDNILGTQLHLTWCHKIRKKRHKKQEGMKFKLLHLKQKLLLQTVTTPKTRRELTYLPKQLLVQRCSTNRSSLLPLINSWYLLCHILPLRDLPATKLSWNWRRRCAAQTTRKLPVCKSRSFPIPSQR